jgi:hypothetical protein
VLVKTQTSFAAVDAASTTVSPGSPGNGFWVQLEPVSCQAVGLAPSGLGLVNAHALEDETAVTEVNASPPGMLCDSTTFQVAGTVDAALAGEIATRAPLMASDDTATSARQKWDTRDLAGTNPQVEELSASMLQHMNGSEPRT